MPTGRRKPTSAKSGSASRKGKRYRVAEGTQVHHEGRVYGAGELVTAPDDVASEWQVSCLVEAAGK